jgi:ATP-binding protein involved in chromosome partitioning
MQTPRRLKSVKYIVAVASCKGGVGKSTTASNLALSLKQSGMQVGLLDADIYGPSQPMILGIPEGTRPVIDGETFEPVMAHGMQTMSLGYLITENTPMIWRGPIVSGTLQKLIKNTKWSDLDYLIVDMPPGTGDVQLTLAQTLQVDAAIIVTIPNTLSLVEVKKAVAMFNKVNIKVAGLVENMAYHTCSNCGHAEHVFGDKKIHSTELNQLDPLAQLPLQANINVQNEAGIPIVLTEQDLAVNAIYTNLAAKLRDRVEPFVKGIH